MDGGAGWPEAGRECARGATERIRSLSGTLRTAAICRTGGMPEVAAERLPCGAKPRPCFHREEEAGLRSVGDLVHGILLRCERDGGRAHARQPSSLSLRVR